MRIALFSDIHANREGLSACLTHARRRGADRFVFLGDYVGYGADPEYAVDRLAQEMERGALAVLGNHDRAVLEPDADLNEVAEIAIAWTRSRLDDGRRAVLASLPLTIREGARLFVHADASAPAQWIYVLTRGGGPELCRDQCAPHRLRPRACPHPLRRGREPP